MLPSRRQPHRAQLDETDLAERLRRAEVFSPPATVQRETDRLDITLELGRTSEVHLRHHGRTLTVCGLGRGPGTRAEQDLPFAWSCRLPWAPCPEDFQVSLVEGRLSIVLTRRSRLTLLQQRFWGR